MIVRTTDAAVIVPAVDDPQKIPATKLWVPFSVCKNFTYIPAHQIASQLGPRSALALPMFHVFTRCDIVFVFLPEKERAEHGKFGKRTQSHIASSPLRCLYNVASPPFFSFDCNVEQLDHVDLNVVGVHTSCLPVLVSVLQYKSQLQISHSYR